MNDKKIPPKKQYYIINVEATAPVHVKYRVLAENADEALKLMEQNRCEIYEKPKPMMARLDKKKAVVFEFGRLVVKATKVYK